MSSYYDRVENNLAAAVTRRAELADRTTRRRRHALAAFCAATIAATVLAFVLGTSGSEVSPAYAVVVKPDGSVALSVRELLGVGPANARLASLGVHARLVRREPGCASRVHGTLTAPGLTYTATRLKTRGGSVTDREMKGEVERARAELRFLGTMIKPTNGATGLGVLIEPASIPYGYTLLLAFRSIRSSGRIAPGATHAIGARIELVKGHAPACLPMA